MCSSLCPSQSFFRNSSQYCIHNSQIDREQNFSALPLATLGPKSCSLSPGSMATVPSFTLTDCTQQIQQFMIKEHKGFQADRYCLAFSGVLLPEKHELISTVPAEREIISDTAKTALPYPQVLLSRSALCCVLSCSMFQWVLALPHDSSEKSY